MLESGTLPALFAADVNAPARKRMPNRVLVVDDDDAILIALAGTLVGAGYDVERASDGREALDAMRERVPDLVLLDLMMPGMSGWEVLSAMGASPRLAAVPVVVLTAFDERKSLPAGRPVLHKPIEPDLLLDLVRTVIEQERSGTFSLDEPPSDLLPRKLSRRSLSRDTSEGNAADTVPGPASRPALGDGVDALLVAVGDVLGEELRLRARAEDEGRRARLLNALRRTLEDLRGRRISVEAAIAGLVGLHEEHRRWSRLKT